MKVDKQISCDGGTSWKDIGYGDSVAEACVAQGADAPIKVWYLTKNTGGCEMTQCSLTESNATFGTPPVVGTLPAGEEKSLPAPNAPICKDACGRDDGGDCPNEPNTVELSCKTPAGSTLKASDSADLECIPSEVKVDNQISCDGGTSWKDIGYGDSVAEACAAYGVDAPIKVQYVGIGFFPGLQLTLDGAHIRNRGTDLISAKQARLGIGLLPLFQKQIRFDKIVLKRPAISIVRDRDGEFNFEKPETPDEALPVLDLANISFSDATLVYTDNQSGAGFEAGNCKLDLRRLRHPGGDRTDLMKRPSFTAQLACGEIRKNAVTVSDLKITVNGKMEFSSSSRSRCVFSARRGRGASGRTFQTARLVTRSTIPCRSCAARSFSCPCRHRNRKWGNPYAPRHAHRAGSCHAVQTHAVLTVGARSSWPI